MRLLLVRHGETVHNVAGVYAGITDSALTNHGVLQAKRLGTHLATNDVKISHIFSSDLQRAFKTAEAIRVAQKPPPTQTVRVQAIREQDFGFYEMKHFSKRPREGIKSGKEAHQDAHRNNPGFQDVESKDSMKVRSDTFIDEHLVQLLHELPKNNTVVVVAHGIILSHLWRAFLKRFHAGKVTVSPGIESAGNGFSLEHLGGWSNTGYLDLEIKTESSASLEAAPASDSESSTGTGGAAEDVAPDDASQKPSTPPLITQASPKFLDMSLVVKAVNKQDHLLSPASQNQGIPSDDRISL
ncbi:hypothetical protein LZ554_005888 [Drepanopeziza brunnea f. sp. 'monogermtubi']|nr:hypothetical protein LZ554_005888 [Drepanopeziza brunnea f. sp. 'monogermtubi']